MRCRTRQTICVAVLGVGLICRVRSVAANDWKGSPTSGLWTTDTNWVSLSQPGASDSATFAGASTVLANVVTLDANRTVAAWQVSGTPDLGAYHFQRTGGASLAVTGNATFQSVDPNHSLAITLDGFVTQVSGQASLANTTTVTMSSGAALIATAGIVLGNSSVLNLAGSSLTTAGSFQLTGTSHVTAAGSTVTANDVIVYSGTALILQAASSLAASHSIHIDGGALTFANSNLSLSAGADVNVSGVAAQLTFSGSFAVPTGSTLNADAGGQIDVPSYLDIGNGRVGTMILDTNATCTAQELSDWGRSAGSNATVTVANGATATLGTLRVGTSDSAATLSVNATGNIATTGSFEMGGGNVVRNCSVSLAGGTLEIGTTATFNNQAVVKLQSAGSLVLHGDTTFNAGSTLDWSGGGALNIAAGKTLAFTGAIVDRGSVGEGLSDGGILNLSAGAQFGGTSFFDIADGPNVSGTMILDGIVGTPTFTAGDICDWGKEAGASALVQLQNSAISNVAALRIGTNNGAAIVSVTTGATLTTSGILTIGGGTIVRPVALNVSSAAVNAQSAMLNENAVINLTSGTLVLRGDSNINTGATFNWSGGDFSIADGKVLRISGGRMNVMTGGTQQGNDSTLVVSAGGAVVGENFYDIANGTMLVDGFPSNITVSGGDALTDWAYNPGNVANVTIQNSGGAVYSNGLELAVGGGTATLSISTSGQLFAGRLVAGGLGTATMSVDVPLVGLNILNTATFSNGATLTVAKGAIHVGGLLTLDGNAKILPATPTSTMSLSVGRLSIDSPSKIDLGSGSLNIAYAGASPAASIRDYLRSGYHGGNWLGNGITSSRVASETGTTLYYNDTGSAIVVGRTLAGDFNIDNKSTSTTSSCWRRTTTVPASFTNKATPPSTASSISMT